MPQSLIEAGRSRDKRIKAAYYANRVEQPVKIAPVLNKPEFLCAEHVISGKPIDGLLSRFVAWSTKNQSKA